MFRPWLTLSVIGAIIWIAGFSGNSAEGPLKTDQLVAVLQSDASLFEKARACQQLGEIGTKEAVPALAALLSDVHLGAYARSGLEGIADPSAAAALREWAGKLKGERLAGIVNSLGALRDEAAVELLSRLAKDPAAGVVHEALLALGNIASSKAIELLQQLVNGPEASRDSATAACLLAADHQRVAGNLELAGALYDAILNAKAPPAYRAGAVRGAILAHKNSQPEFLLEKLRSDELLVRNAALLTIREVPSPELATALNAELSRTGPELQKQLLLALVDCHNPQSTAAVDTLSQTVDPETRKVALMVLGQLGPSAAPALLAALQREPTPEQRTIILDGLKRMESDTVSDLLLQDLEAATAPRTRIDLIGLLESRGVTTAADELLKQTTAPEKEVSIAALSALKSLATSRELPDLISFTKSCQDEAVREAAENALAGACTRIPDEAAGAGVILHELQTASAPGEKNCWVRVLVLMGYGKALPAIETATKDPDETVAKNALEQLGRWPDAAPIESLLAAMEKGATPARRQRALISVIDLATTVADEKQRPEAAIVAWLQRADSATPSTAEKRRILGILGRLPTVESFRLLESHLDNPALRTEAAAGIMQIAPALTRGSEAAAVKTALEKIASTVDNQDIRTRAQQLARTIKKSSE